MCNNIEYDIMYGIQNLTLFLKGKTLVPESIDLVIMKYT